VYLLQFAQSHSFKVGEPGNPFAGKQGLRIAAMKTLNHAIIITTDVINYQGARTSSGKTTMCLSTSRAYVKSPFFKNIGHICLIISPDSTLSRTENVANIFEKRGVAAILIIPPTASKQW
jgi:hypothetical protein